MINQSYKTKLFMFRTMLDILLKEYPEEKEIFVYFTKDLKKPITVLEKINKNLYNLNEILIYKTTIKEFYLYCLKEEYIDTNWDLLVLLANKSIKGYSSEQMAILIGVSLDKYKHLEMGYYNFTNELSYEKISEKIEFNKEEFYFTFNKSFKYIGGETN